MEKRKYGGILLFDPLIVAHDVNEQIVSGFFKLKRNKKGTGFNLFKTNKKSELRMYEAPIAYDEVKAIVTKEKIIKQIDCFIIDNKNDPVEFKKFDRVVIVDDEGQEMPLYTILHENYFEELKQEKKRRQVIIEEVKEMYQNAKKLLERIETPSIPDKIEGIEGIEYGPFESAKEVIVPKSPYIEVVAGCIDRLCNIDSDLLFEYAKAMEIEQAKQLITYLDNQFKRLSKEVEVVTKKRTERKRVSIEGLMPARRHHLIV